MSETTERYETVAGGFDRRVAGVVPGQWAAASPCEGWSARDVVAHVVDTHRRVLATLEGREPVVVGPDDDVTACWRSVRTDLLAALTDPARAGTTVSGMFGEQSFESLVGRLLCTDTLVHTWDLARATGQDEQLDAAAVAAGRAFLEPIDDAIRRPGGFAPKLEAPAGADPQTAFLAFCGRAV
jgi:uncharacterized protein (TIGR03086 family)